MKLLSLALMLVLCTCCQAISFSTVAKVSVMLISLNKPVSCFFGLFRRRKTPPIQETPAPPDFPLPPMGMFNQFGGFGGGNMFMPPGFGNQGFGMSNRFPPQFPSPPKKPPSQPKSPNQMFPPQQSGGAPKFPPQMQGMPPQMQGMQGMPPHMQGMQGMPPEMQGMQGMQGMPPMPDDMDSFNEQGGDDEAPGMNTEEAESFFTLLSETDESKCISRLVCEMGANPQSGGEFGRTIVDIIGGLKDFPEGSKVSEYNEVLNIGLSEGLSSCRSKYSVCDEESFEMVKKAQLEDEGQN